MTSLRVHGAEVSYFTGKLEGYLRYKEIPYEHVPATRRHFSRTLPRHTGVVQVPAVELPDGRWLTDTTPIIAWLETLTNVRVVRDEESTTGWKVEVGPFPGWAEVPEW